jgi:protein-arginine kinase activator protein McsA
LANLIVEEANELGDGHKESYSLSQLLESVHHLFAWYQGEVAEGEVNNSAETKLEDDSEEMSMKDASEEMKCKECGTDLDDEAMKGMCGKCYKAADSDQKEEDVDSEKSATIDFSDDQVSVIVEKAVAQAKASVTEEIALLKSALEAEQLEKTRIADELVTAKKAVAPTGPQRTGSVTPDITNNALLQKAAEYSLKASQTTDPILAKGYKELADEARLQANS